MSASRAALTGSYEEVVAGPRVAIPRSSFLLELSAGSEGCDFAADGCEGCGADSLLDGRSPGPTPVCVHIAKMQTSLGSGLCVPFCRLFSSTMYSSTPLSL